MVSNQSSDLRHIRLLRICERLATPASGTLSPWRWTKGDTSISTRWYLVVGQKGFYRWPTVTGSILKDHSSGLIVLSGCADSLVSCTLLGGKGIEPPERPNLDGAVRVAQSFKRLFGDRYYLEVQQFPALTRTRQLNPLYQELSQRTGIPLVATADCHYPMPNDNDMQKILHSASRNTGTVLAAEAEWEYNILLTLPTSDKQIHDNLVGTGLNSKQAWGAIESTVEIAARCNVVLPKSSQIRYPLPEGFNSAEELMWEWLREGWKYRWTRQRHMRDNPKMYEERLKYEMSVITKKDYCDYFLVTSEAVKWAKDVPEVPVGPARGSAAGCLIAYLMRITEVNPMLFPTMMFERFIDEGRADPPDIDLDFADDRRYLLREHLADKYGADHVGNIGNFTKYRGKNSIDDVARVHRIPKYEAKIVKDLVIERSGGDSRFDASLGDTRTMFPQAQAVFERHPNLEYAIRLEGNYKSMGVHAAGLVVSQDPISSTCATYEREVKGHKVDIIAYDKKDAEYLNMLKMDFLGLATMGMIDIALKMIGMKLDELYQLPLDDPDTLAAFTRADVVGIFQFDGRATRLMTQDVVPTTFMEIADINALSRPGPLFSGASAKYVEVKHGREEPVHLHPIVDKWTAHSKFQIIYQEQVLSILRDMGGFPGSVTGALRKIISLKLGEAQFNEWYQAFIDGAKKHHGVEPELADTIWKLMVTSATYSFNIAHCISYGMLAYWSMWIKVHHPMAFYCAALAKKSKPEDWRTLILDAEKHGINVMPPDLRYSGVTWTPHPNGRDILGGLIQVNGIGTKTAPLIAAWLDENGRPDSASWSSLQKIKGIGPKTTDKIEKWINSEDPYNLYYAQRVLGDLRDAVKARQLYLSLKPNYRSDEIPRDADRLPVCWMGIPNKREYKDFIEDERARSGRDPEEILATMKSPDKIKSCVVKAYDDGEEEVYLRFNRFKFPQFKDMLEDLKTDGTQVVVAKGKKNKGFGINVQVEQMIVIDIGEMEDEEDELIEEAS